jgi:hypothetical protein
MKKQRVFAAMQLTSIFCYVLLIDWLPTIIDYLESSTGTQKMFIWTLLSPPFRNISAFIVLITGFNSEIDEDIPRLKTVAVSVLSDMGLNGAPLSEDLITEMCRFGGAEIHPVAGFIGGVASQEVIKVCYAHFTR